MTSARLHRYASFLSGFDYSLKCKKGKDNQNVDCLSRAPLQYSSVSPDQLIGNEVNQLHYETVFQISGEAITYSTIREETSKDETLKRIIQDMETSSKENEYTLTDGILFRQDRIVIPGSLRSKVLDELHETHLGITKMKQLARRYVYWPSIDRDIEHLVKSCESCALTRTNPPKVLVHPWDPPQENWERIHIDYAGPFQNRNFLVVVDAKSKWAEIKTVKEAPTTSLSISLLESIFATHGYPQVMVSDNASIFKSAEMKAYCKINGIFQKFIAPGHPATNGLAERNVQTLKKRLEAATNDNSPIQDKVQNILFRYRATPLACGKSPAELYLHRKLRIRLDAIFPYTPQGGSDPLQSCRSLQVGERIQARFFRDNHDVWEFGTVKKKLGTRHYLVTLDSGRVLKRHVNQLRQSLVANPRNQVTFGSTEIFDIPRIPALPQQEAEVPRNQIPDQQMEPGPEVTPEPTYRPQPQQRPQRDRRRPARYGDYVM